ncbi:MAG: ATP-binding domain-containing protein [Sphaerospermopsis sp. SIO1G2]|nr:ATP-binding domain-containing protein [Sphaerospermopsis sp. SIO1G2]
MDIVKSDEFDRTFDLLEHSERSLFLTGKAGTGKSTFLQYFRKHTAKNVVVVAPTGVAALNAMRVGESNDDTLDYLNQRVGQGHPADSRYITLTPTNALADATNERTLRELPGTAYQYEGKITGKFNLQGNKLPAPELLTLKAGAQVMFTRNDNREGRWVNGTLGVVTQLSAGSITVEVNGHMHEVNQEKWETLAYEFDDAENKIVEKVTGSYRQYPLMPAWAITIHKSQGKTLDHVTLDLGSGAFAPGQLYVALSRCTSLGGLCLTRAIEPSDIIAPNIRLAA